MAGRGGFFFFSRRDGAVVFFFGGGTGRLFFFSEAGRGGCFFFPRRDGVAFYFFFDGTGRDGVFFFFRGPGRDGCFWRWQFFWRDGAKSLHRPAKGGLNRPASRPCKALNILSRRCPLLATFLSVLFCLLSLLIYDFRFDSVWFRLSCDHGWFSSGSVNVRKTTTNNT